MTGTRVLIAQLILVLETDKQTEVFFKSMYSFYSNYLLWVIRNCMLHPEDQEKKPDTFIPGSVNPLHYFEISGCNKDNIRLAVTPLNVSLEIYLCVYFEPAYKIRKSIGDSEGFKELFNRISSSIHC